MRYLYLRRRGKVFDNLDIEVVNLNRAEKIGEVRNFLAKFELTYEDNLEYTILLRLDGIIIGTGSFKDEVLRNIAIEKMYQGLGLTSIILTKLIQEQARRGRMHYFIFTKPEKASSFVREGFLEIVRAEPYVALLETGLGSVREYCDSVNTEVSHLKGNRAALVLKCDPFTKGHRAFIQKAASENEAVIVFVVNDAQSLLPLTDRLKMVKEGVLDLANVAVVAGDKYISQDMFPTYFLHSGDHQLAQARLDITLFAEQIAPRLDISCRYIGEEPCCAVSSVYHQSMLDIFPKYSLALKVIKAIEFSGNVV
jgi:[citrate (pro-3S)-lyase] ligase